MIRAEVFVISKLHSLVKNIISLLFILYMVFRMISYLYATVVFEISIIMQGVVSVSTLFDSIGLVFF